VTSRIDPVSHCAQVARQLQTGFVMLPPKKHMIILARLMAILFLIASSGFSAVLQRCTIGTADCCGGSDPACMNCQDALPPQAGLEIHGSARCHATSLAGGATTDPAVVQKDNYVGHSVLTGLAHQGDSGVWAVPLTDQRSSVISLLQSCNTTSPVEKYILHSVFLN